VAVLVYRDREVAVEFVNDYAPEHLALWLPDEELEDVLDRVENAGSVFLGPWTPVALGDYAAGTNHILPTAGGARFASGLSVEAFCKAIAVQRVRPEGLRALAPTTIALAEAEGLPAHAESIRLRLRGNHRDEEDAG
jgi:histidinol dehydrogenase